MTLVSGTPGTGDSQSDPALYELDVNALRLALKDIEDSEGMPYPDTHRHNSEVTISGVTYARTFEIINGYTVLFDVSTYDHYSVRFVGANHNIADVRRPNTVSLIIGNSAGLITVSSGSGLSAQQATQLLEIWKLHGLGSDLNVTATRRYVGPSGAPEIDQDISEAAGTTTVTRTA
jgi:hypothetical protein